MKTFFSVLMFAAILCVAASSAFAQDKLTNSEVISLTKAGLASSVILEKIRTSQTDFDTSTDGLIALKQAGVADDVVAAMVSARTGGSRNVPAPGGDPAGDPNDPMSKHGFGIYLYQEEGGVRKMTQLQPNMSAQNRTGGAFTASMTPFGLGKVKTKTNLPGRSANVQIKDTSPVFYFYLDSTSGGLNTSSGIPSTPNEFTLVRFNQRSDNREVTIAKTNSWGSKGGLSDEYVVALTAEPLGNGVFKVTATAPLKKGEYGFMMLNSGNANTAAGVGSKFFDFGVNMTP